MKIKQIGFVSVMSAAYVYARSRRIEFLRKLVYGVNKSHVAFLLRIFPVAPDLVERTPCNDTRMVEIAFYRLLPLGEEPPCKLHRRKVDAPAREFTPNHISRLVAKIQKLRIKNFLM